MNKNVEQVQPHEMLQQARRVSSSVATKHIGTKVWGFPQRAARRRGVLERAKQPAWALVSLAALLGGQVVLPATAALAQSAKTASARKAVPTAGHITVKPRQVHHSTPLLRPDQTVSLRALDLSRPPTEKELQEVGGMGGPLSPTESADTRVWKRNGAEAKDIERLEAMNLAFGRAIQQRMQRNFTKAHELLEQYLKDYPNSPWAAEAMLRLAFDAQHGGRPGEAQARYNAIIQNTSEDPQAPSYDIHQKAKMGWADQDIELGLYQDAATKLKDILATEVDWRRRTWAEAWLQRVLLLPPKTTKERRACGPAALSVVLASLGEKAAAAQVANLKTSNEAGFSLAELQQEAQRRGVALVGFESSVEELAKLPMPVLIHYSLDRYASDQSALPQLVKAQSARVGSEAFKIKDPGHFLVVRSVDGKAGLARLYDPEAKVEYVLTLRQLAREWSGAGLMLAHPQTRGIAPAVQVAQQPGARLTLLSERELAQIRGACCCNPLLPGGGGPNPNNQPVRPGGCGTPAISVNRSTLNVYISDTPVWYKPAIGPLVAINISYNSQDSFNWNNIFGNKWAVSLGGYIIENPDGRVYVNMPGGTVLQYYPNGSDTNNYLYTAQTGNFSTLTKSKTDANHFEMTTPEGDKYIFDTPTGFPTYGQPVLIQQMDRWGNSLQIGYESRTVSGLTYIHPTTITDAQGKITNLIYDAGFQHVTDVVTPYGQRASFEYSGNQLVKVWDMEGNEFDYAYDEAGCSSGLGNITSLTTAQGDWDICWFFDSSRLDLKTTVTDPLGQVETFNSKEYETFYTDKRGNDTTSFFNTTATGDHTATGDDPKLTDVYLGHDTSGVHTHTDYDPATGQPSLVQNGRGKISKYTYNSMGRLTSETDPKGNTTTYIYDTNNIDLLEVDNADGLPVVAYSNYNSQHQPQTVTRYPNTGEAANVSTLTYTSWGPVSTVTDPNGDVTTYNYDSTTKLLTSVTRTHSLTTVTMASYTYDDHNRVASKTDVNGTTLSYSYNELNKRVNVTYPGSTSAQTTYLCCDLPGAVKDRAGHWTFYDYDALKRLVRVQDERGYDVQYQYDPNGNLSTIIDSLGNVTSYAYDRDNEMVRKSYHGGRSETLIYDEDGNPSRYSDAAGVQTSYAYDDDDNLITIDRATSAGDVTFGYDNQDRMSSMVDYSGTTTFTYDRQGILRSEDGPYANDKLTYTPDALGRRATTTTTLPSGSTEQVSYSYDYLGRLDAVTNPAGTFDYQYSSNNDLLTYLRMPNGTYATYIYDGFHRPSSIHNRKLDNTYISKYQFGYGTSTNDAITSVQATIGAGATQTINYGYDNSYQLTSEASTETPTPLLSKTYTYDGMGNRTAATEADSYGTLSDNYGTANPLNQITQITHNGGGTNTLNYDNNGNLANSTDTTLSSKYTYTYDSANRLFQVLRQNRTTSVNEHLTTYYYDGLNRKRTATESDWVNGVWSTVTTIHYVYDGVNVVQERDASNNVKVAYTWAGSIGSLLSRTVKGTGGGADAYYYYHYDGRGNVVQVTDNNQNVVASYSYDAYGVKLTGPDTYQPYMYSTKEYNSNTGLYDYGLRFYAPSLGRWLKRDPIREAGGLNLYGFVANNPVNLVDVNGLWGAQFGNFPNIGRGEPTFIFDADDFHAPGSIGRGLLTGDRYSSDEVYEDAVNGAGDWAFKCSKARGFYVQIRLKNWRSTVQDSFMEANGAKDNSSGAVNLTGGWTIDSGWSIGGNASVNPGGLGSKSLGAGYNIESHAFAPTFGIKRPVGAVSGAGRIGINVNDFLENGKTTLRLGRDMGGIEYGFVFDLNKLISPTPCECQ
jgi:RHS repeat-associated protein